jgi:hypothetical protein
MPEITFKCWNCGEEKSKSELAEVSLIVKICASVVMLIVARDIFYPRRTCKQCEHQLITFSVIGLFIIAFIAAAAAFSLR